VLTVTTLVWRQRFARPYLLTGWLWFLGTLVPVIGLIQVGQQASADRYAYIPLIGIFVMMVWGAADLADHRQLSFQSRARIAAIVLAILVLFTCDQLRCWRSAVDLWAQTVDVTKMPPVFAVDEEVLFHIDKRENNVKDCRFHCFHSLVVCCAFIACRQGQSVPDRNLA
jgi:hypothetical protein